jgi:hypothetical protein
VIRRLVAGLIVVGLAVGILALWPREDPTTPTTLPAAVDTTTTTTPAGTSTESVPTTDETHVVTSVEEAEVILRELWFGWFEGIYNQDEERIKEVVGTQAMLDSARDQFGVMAFARAPLPSDLDYSDSELMRADEMCLVVWTETMISGFTEATTSDVHVLRFADDRWVLVSLWQERNDLWDTDCEAQLEPFS